MIFHRDSAGSVIETLKYESGVLKSHNIDIGGSNVRMKHEALDDNSLEENTLTSIPFDKMYFEILQLSTLGNDDQVSIKTIEGIQSATSALVTSVFKSYMSCNGHDIWEGNVTITAPKVKVKKYPFSQGEKENLNNSSFLLEESNSIIDDFLTDSQVEISRNSNDTIAKYYKVYQYYDTALNVLDQVFEELREPAIEYVRRSRVIPKLFVGTEYPENISYDIDGQSVEFPFDFPNSLKAEQATISLLFNQLESIHKKLVILNTTLQPLLDKEKQRVDLAEDERKLVEKRDSILHLFGSENELNEYQLKVAQSVTNYIQEKFKSYAKQPLDERVETLSSILSCYSSFIELYDQLEALPKQVRELKILYTRTVWNPFTMTDMDEIVKERVYNAYRNTLLDFCMEKLENNIRCGNVESSMSNFELLFKKMKMLREQDTSELEREIVRETDPVVLINAFGLKIETSE